MIKRHIYMLLVATALLSMLCACSTNNKVSPADTYLSMAEDFTAQGNYDAALEILQKGFSETKDERIAIMIAELSSSTSHDNTTNAITETSFFKSFAGTWAEEDIGWEFGGLILDITDTTEGLVGFSLCYTQGAPASRLAEVFQTVPIEDIKGNKLTFSFEDDGWGQTGTITLEFEQDEILCTISNVEYPGTDYPNWGFCDDYYILVKNETAHEAMEYTEDEYYELYPEDQFDEENNGNMSIEEMKKSCLMLNWEWNDFVHDTTLSPCTRSDLLENPNAYINRCFVPCETLTNYIVCPDCQGSGFRHGIADKGKCYNKGYKSTDKTENGIHYILQEYPDQAMLKAISISTINVDVNGTIIYEHQYQENLIGDDYIYDMREDKSVVITENTTFVPYLVFLGTVDGKLKFGMFACDIVR